MTKPLVVFLCSTYADLAEERGRVLDAVRRLQLQHDSMEFFGARAGLPIETCLAEVRRSDVLVVIVGHRYGNLVPELGVSFSEAEYREGHRLGKPCLVYIRDDEVPVLLRHIERDPDKVRLLDQWKQDLTTRHTVAKFSDSQQLAVQVAADLGRTAQGLHRAQIQPEELENTRLAALDIDGWHLLSGVAQHHRSPATFEIPAEQERRSLAEGDIVKLVFEIAVPSDEESDDVSGERMWVIVRGRSGPYYIGELNNVPACSGEQENLQAGDRVIFLPEHVISILDEDGQELELPHDA